MSDLVILVILAIIWVGIFGGIGAWIARSKGRSGWEGLLLGIALGVVGWAIEVLSPVWGALLHPASGATSFGPTTWNGVPNAAVVQPCSACRSPVPPTARFCPNCGTNQGNPPRCSACGTTAPMGASYCASCGRGLDRPAA